MRLTLIKSGFVIFFYLTNQLANHEFASTQRLSLDGFKLQTILSLTVS